MEIKILSKEYEPKWAEYVNTHPNSEIYNTLIWRDVINKSYGYEPKYYIALENNKIIGVMPLFLIKKFGGNKKLSSGPFTSYSYMLTDSNQVTEALISNAIEEAKRFKVGYIELKPVKKLDEEILNKFKLTEAKPYKLTTVRLTDYETLNKSFSTGLRENLKRYQRKMGEINLKFNFENNENDLKELHNLILKEYMYKFGIPCSPYKTFKTMYQLLKQDYKIFTIKNEKGKIVAGHIFIISNDKAVYLYSTTHKDYTKLNLSKLLMGNAIKWCCDNNLKLFSFGPSSPSQESLISFKEQWGSITKDMYYYHYPVLGKVPKNFDFSSGHSQLRKICRFLPLSLIKLILPIVAKQMG